MGIKLLSDIASLQIPSLVSEEAMDGEKSPSSMANTALQVSSFSIRNGKLIKATNRRPLPLWRDTANEALVALGNSRKYSYATTENSEGVPVCRFVFRSKYRACQFDPSLRYTSFEEFNKRLYTRSV